MASPVRVGFVIDGQRRGSTHGGYNLEHYGIHRVAEAAYECAGVMQCIKEY